LDALRRFAPLSRAELAARTGLNRSTVSIIVNSLIEEGLEIVKAVRDRYDGEKRNPWV
jgi:DNA-binding IclR family transcriptional regulator